MYIPFSKASKLSSIEGIIWDYDINKDVGLSYQKLIMRGPKTGQYLNKVSHEIFFIIKGTAKFHVGNEVYDVKEHDVVVVEPGTLYHIETIDLTYITITRPDWTEDQYELVK